MASWEVARSPRLATAAKKLNQCFARQHCRSCPLSLSITPLLLQTDHGKSLGGKASSFVQILAILPEPQNVQDATEGQSEAPKLHQGQHPAWVLTAIAMPAWDPQSRTPQNIWQRLFCPPSRPVSARCAGNRFRSPIKCLANELQGWLPSFLAPWLRERLALYRTWAFKAKYAALWCFQSQDVPGKNSRQMWPHLLSPWKNHRCEWGGVWVV